MVDRFAKRSKILINKTLNNLFCIKNKTKKPTTQKLNSGPSLTPSEKSPRMIDRQRTALIITDATNHPEEKYY